MSVFTSLVLTLLAMALVGCSDGLIDVEPGPIVTTTRIATGYDRIAVARACNVEVRQGTSDTVQISAPEGYLPYINVTVVNGQLIIDLDDDVDTDGWESNRFVITVPTLNGIDISGASSVIMRDTLTTQRLLLGCSGASRADLRYVANEFNGAISGASTVTMVGMATVWSAIAVSGASTVRAFDAPVGTAGLAISGASTLEVTASGELTGAVSGASLVRYKGQPVIRLEISGGSRIESAN
jgi:hypothetical protein